MTTAEVTDTMSTEEDSTAARTTAISSGREVDDDTTRLVLAILYCSQAVLTSAGNGLVLFVLCRSRLHRRTPSASLAMNIAVSDLLLAATLLLHAVFLLDEEKMASRVWCMTFVMFMCFTSLAVQLSLMLLVLERYIAIRHPFHYISVVKQRNVAVALTSLWVYSLVVMLLSLHPFFRQLDTSLICQSSDTPSENYVLLLVIHWLVISLLCLLANASVTTIACRQNARVRAARVGVVTSPKPHLSHGQRPESSVCSFRQEGHQSEAPSVGIVVVSPTEHSPSSCRHEASAFTFPEEPVSTFPEKSVYTFPDGSVSTFPEELAVTCPEKSVPEFPDGSVSTFPDGSVSTFPDRSISIFPEESVFMFCEESRLCEGTSVGVVTVSESKRLFHRERHEGLVGPFLRDRVHYLESEEASVDCFVSAKHFHTHTHRQENSELSRHPEHHRSDLHPIGKRPRRDEHISIEMRSPKELLSHNNLEELVLCSRKEDLQSGTLAVGMECVNKRLVRSVRQETLVLSECQEDAQFKKTSATVVPFPRHTACDTQNLEHSLSQCCQHSVLRTNALVGVEVPGEGHVPARAAISLELEERIVERSPSRRVSCERSSSQNQPLPHVSIKQDPASEVKMKLFPVCNRTPGSPEPSNSLTTPEPQNRMRTSESTNTMRTPKSNYRTRTSASNNTTRTSESIVTTGTSESSNTTRTSASNNTTRTSESIVTTGTSESSNTTRTSESIVTTGTSESSNTTRTSQSSKSAGTLESSYARTSESDNTNISEPRSPLPSDQGQFLQVPPTASQCERLSRRPTSSLSSLSSEVSGICRAFNPLTENNKTKSSNILPELSNTLPQLFNTLPQSLNTLPQSSNKLPPSASTTPKSSNALTQSSSTLPRSSSILLESQAGPPKTSLQWSVRRSFMFLKRSGVLYLLFSLSWCPFAIVELMEMAGIPQSLTLRRVVAMFISITPATNPIVYVWGNIRFRRAFTQLWRRPLRTSPAVHRADRTSALTDSYL